MESNKGPSNNSQESTSEKTAFEKFELEVKEVVFGILSVLLKDDESSMLGFVINSVLDSFQMYQFIFDPRFPWEIMEVINYISIIANALNLQNWIGYSNSWIAYVIIFYVFIAVVALMILDIIYVAYSFTKKKFAFIWPVHLLRNFCGLVVTVLFQPFLEYFTSMLVCQVGKDGITMYHQIFTDQVCFEGLHILHSSFAAIIGILFIGLCIIVVYTFFEPKSKTNDPSARSDSKCEIFFIVFKLLLTMLYSFLYSDSYRWLLVILLCCGSTYLYYSISHDRPYYNETASRFLNCLHGGYMYSSYVLLAIMVLNGLNFTAGLQLLVIGYPVFIIIILVFSDGRTKILLKPIEDFDSGKEYQIKTRFFLTLYMHKEANKHFNNILKGYVYDHEDTCTVADCPLKAYKTSMYGLLNDRKKKTTKGNIIENNPLLLNYANKLFLAGLAKFPECTSLRISYSFFLMEHMDNKSRAVVELGIAEKNHPPFDEEFIIYQYKKSIEDEMQESHADGSGNLDIVNGIAYDNHFRQCKSSIEKTAQYHHEFWTILMDDKPDFIKLDKAGSKINTAVASVEDHWARLQKISPNEPKSLRVYSEFLIEIMNDKETGNELLSRAKDTALSKVNFVDSNIDQNLLQGDGAACIVASGETNKMGEILKFNQSTSRIFGYNNIDLQGRNINMLIPEMLIKNHDQIMLNTVNNNDDLKDNPEKIVLGKHKCGYIMALHKKVHTAPSFTEGLQFISVFKTEKRSQLNTSICYIMTDNNKEIRHLSSSAQNMIGISNRMLQKARCFVTVFCPTLFDKKENQQLNPELKNDEIEFALPENLKEDDSNQSNALNSGIASDKKSQFAPHKSNEEFKPRMGASAQNKKKLKYFVSGIEFKDIGQVGFCIRFETLTTDHKKCKKFEKLPEFQYLYNVEEKKYYRVMQRPKEAEAEQENKNQEEEESSFSESKVSFSSDNENKEKEGEKKEDNELKPKAISRKATKMSKDDRKGDEKEGDDYEDAEDDEDYDDSYEYDEDEEGEDEDEFEESEGKISQEDGNTGKKKEKEKDKEKGKDKEKEKETDKEKSKEDKNETETKIDLMLKDVDMTELEFEDFDKGVIELRKAGVIKDHSATVNSKRLGMDGMTIDISQNQNEEEAKKMDEDKKEEDKKDDQGEDKNLELFRNNIKSKKVLNAAIKEKVEPPAISKLKKTAYVLILLLLALISSEYGVMLSQFSDISENLDLVIYGYQRKALQMRIVYDIGKLVYYSKLPNFSVNNNSVNLSRIRIESELNEYYNVQNQISLSKIALSTPHQALYNTKAITLYFNEKTSAQPSKKKMYFTLTEAILQMTSSIFTILNLKLEKNNFNASMQDDVSFVLFNAFSDFTDKITESANYYVTELLDRSTSKNRLIMIFFILSLSAMLISIAICFPLITSVGRTRLGVLELFLNIPMQTIKILIQKCEKYTNKTPENANEEGDSLNNESFSNNENTNNANDSLNLVKKVKKRYFSNNNTSNTPFFLKYIFGSLLLESYFAVNYGLAVYFLQRVVSYGLEMNITAMAEEHDTYCLAILQ